jgi:hypothetical protein
VHKDPGPNCNTCHGDPRKSQCPMRHSEPRKAHLAGRIQPGGSQGPSKKQGVRTTPVLNNYYDSWQPGHIAGKARNSDPKRPQFSQSKRSRCPICGKKGHVCSQCWHRDPKRAQSPHNPHYQGNGPQGGSGSRGSPAAETAWWKYIPQAHVTVTSESFSAQRITVTFGSHSVKHGIVNPRVYSAQQVIVISRSHSAPPVTLFPRKHNVQRHRTRVKARSLNKVSFVVPAYLKATVNLPHA